MRRLIPVRMRVTRPHIAHRVALHGKRGSLDGVQQQLKSAMLRVIVRYKEGRKGKPAQLKWSFEPSSIVAVAFVPISAKMFPLPRHRHLCLQEPIPDGLLRQTFRALSHLQDLQVSPLSSSFVTCTHLGDLGSLLEVRQRRCMQRHEIGR